MNKDYLMIELGKFTTTELEIEINRRKKELEVKVICHDCNGKGLSENYDGLELIGRSICYTCNGTGKLKT